MVVEVNGQSLEDPLLGVRTRANYNAAERWFSCVLQERLHALLQGKWNRLALLRRYPDNPDRLGVIPTPPGLPREQLRLPVVDALILQTIREFCSNAIGGPVAQSVAADGSVNERKTFYTKFPHIVLERTDRYLAGSSRPSDITWSLRRIQNQRAATEFNRLLDAANLALEVLRLIP